MGILAALLLALAGSLEPQESAIVIVLDDIAAADLALYGGPVQTPYLAQVAGQGVLFTNAYAAPTCAPTRRMMQTGHYWATGTGNACEAPNANWPTASEVFIPEVLTGHVSAMIGKWHLGGNIFGGSYACAPLNHGYQYFLAGSSSNVLECGGSSYSYWEKLEASATACTISYDSTYEPTAVTQAFRNGWLGTSGPRFGMICPNLAHEPFHSPPSFLLPQGYVVPNTARGKYEAMIVALDMLVGQMLSAVDLNNTMVIIIGDNGTPPRVAPGFDRAKTTVYERGIKVPLIVAGGCTVGGRVSDKLVGAVDIYATVIEALGYPVPATSGGYPVASKSFLKILTNDPTHVERDYLFTGARWGSPETELAAISKEKLKLRQYDATGDFVIDQEELFDLVLDPNEQVNLVNDPAYLSDLNILRAYITGSVLP